MVRVWARERRGGEGMVAARRERRWRWVLKTSVVGIEGLGEGVVEVERERRPR